MNQLATTNPVGAPTKYTRELIDKAKHYLDNHLEYGKNVPSIARLAQVLEITEVTLYEWAKHDDKKELTNTLALILQKQKIDLIENGLDTTYNSNITKLMLYNHGMSDKPTEQGSSKITVNVNRGNITIESGSDKLTISTEKDITL